MNIAVLNLKFNTQSLEAQDVHVNFASTDITTAWHRHNSLAKTRNKGTQNSS